MSSACSSPGEAVTVHILPALYVQWGFLAKAGTLTLGESKTFSCVTVSGASVLCTGSILCMITSVYAITVLLEKGDVFCRQCTCYLKTESEKYIHGHHT